MNYAYYRSSVPPGTIMMQRSAVRLFCAENGLAYPRDCGVDIISGKVPWRKRNLARIINLLEEGDLLIACEMSRLSRDFFELCELGNIILNRGAGLRFSRFPTFRLARDGASVCMFSQMAMNSQMENEQISKRRQDALDRRRQSVRVKLVPYADEIRKAFVNWQQPIGKLARAYQVEQRTLKKFIVEYLKIPVEKYIYSRILVPKAKNDEIRRREELRRLMRKIDPYEEPDRWIKQNGPLPHDVQVSMKMGTFPRRFYYPEIEPFLTDIDILMRTGVISEELQAIKEMQTSIDDEMDRIDSGKE